MSTVIEFKDPAALIEKYDAMCESGGFFIVYMTGGEFEGVNWCPDCVNAKPAIDEHILGKTQMTVLKGVVDDKTTWCGVQTHPYKTHPVLKAGGVPSVVLVDGDSKQVRVRAESPDDFSNEDLLAMIATPEE